MNDNRHTVVADYHKRWDDGQPRKEMVEVNIGVHWYTIDERPNWHPSFNARLSRVVSKGTYNGNPHNVYETMGIANKLDELWYDMIWMKYVGKKMPRFKNDFVRDVCRPDTIFDQPSDLIEVLKKYEKDPRTKKFVCGTGKFHVEAHNEYRRNEKEVQVDPNPTQEEITSMVMLFKTKAEAKQWIEEVMAQVKGFTPEQIEKNKK